MKRIAGGGGTPVILLNHLAAVLDNWDPRVDISGDFVEVMWLQGLTEYLQPTK